MMSYQDAINLISGSSKFQHSLLTSRIMKIIARKLNENESVWVLVGLLHDLDYDDVEDYCKHGIIACEKLEGQLPENALHAIMAHDYRTSIKPKSVLDETLSLSDSIANYLERQDNISNEDVSANIEEKPWLFENITKYSEKYGIDILEIIESLIT